MPKRRGKGEGSIFKRKDGTWQGAVTVGYTKDGKQKRKTIYGKTQKEVREKIDAIKGQLASGTFTDTDLTLEQYLTRWLKEKERQVKPRTIESYTDSITRYLLPRLGKTRLDKLSPLKVQIALGEVADHHGARTSNLCRAILFSALRQAVKWQLLPFNPIEGITRVKEEKRDMTLWTSAEALRFLKVASEHRLYPLFYLAMATGLRCGELLGLQWADLKGLTLHVKRALNTRSGSPKLTTPKTNKGIRRVVLSPDVMKVLKAHRKRQQAEKDFLKDAWAEPDFIFVSELGTLLYAHNVTRIWHALQDRAGVPRARLHDARHLQSRCSSSMAWTRRLLRTVWDTRTHPSRYGSTVTCLKSNTRKLP